MDMSMQQKWEDLHKQTRFRPKYPVESVIQFVFKNFKRDKQTKILDLGCGAGRHVYFLANENIDAHGVDISKDGIAYTQKLLSENGLKANLEVSSVDSIPFADEYFDGIICYAVLYYCKSEQIGKAAKEIYRVLKHNGLAFIEVRDINDYRFGQGKEIEKNTFLISEEDCQKNAFNENGMVMHFFTEEEIKSLFKDFKNITIDKIIESHENSKYCDSNFRIILRK
jgi:ubiquinone/menaquinone biosynthesis C-methylase UbiE